MVYENIKDLPNSYEYIFSLRYNTSSEGMEKYI